MSEDKIVQLSEIEDSGEIELGRGNVISTGDLSAYPGDYPVYSSSAVGSGEFGRYGKFMFDEQLITWSVDGGGRPFLRKKHRFSVTNVCGYLRIRDPRKWDYGYLHAAILKAHEKIQFDYQAKAHPSVIRELYHLRWVPITEQRLIANILDTLDTQIQKAEALIAKLEKVKEGLLHDLLTRGIDKNGQLRPSPEQAPELYKESPLGLIPREWETRTIAEQTSGISYGFTNPMPSTSEGPWMLTAADIINGRVSYANARHTSYSAYTKLSSKSRPRIGEILITKDGTLGRVAIVDQEEVCINQSVASFMPRDAQMGRFMLLYLASPLGQEAMLADAGGSTIKHLYISKLSQMYVPHPEPTEASEIAKIAGSLFDKIELEKRSFHELSKFKSGLMDDLLTGHVRVTPLLDQVKSTSPA